MINININDDTLSGAVLDVVDSLTVHTMKQSREGMINEYENAKAGHSNNVFVVDDAEADALEIRRYIEAFDLILDYFSLNHEAYEFKDEDTI